MQPPFEVDGYDWLEQATRRFAEIGAEFDFDWKFRLGTPATSEVIDRAERELGLTLPPSLRRFYLAHDGAQIAYYEIATLRDLCDRTLLARTEDLKVYEEPVDDLLCAVDLGDANRYVLDSSRPDPEGEYPVLDAFHEVGPTQWRETVISPSFGAWLRTVFDDVLVRGYDPLFEQPLDEATFSSRYLYGAALAAFEAGDGAKARTLVLRAIEWDALGEESYLERGVALLRRLGVEHAGDSFLLQLLDYAVAARRAGKPHANFQSGGGINTPESFQRRFGIVVPPVLTGIMRRYSSVTLFQKAQYPAPNLGRTAALEIFGGGYHGIRPATDIASAATGSIVIGAIGNWQMLSFGGGDAYDVLFIDPAGSLFRAPFRAHEVGAYAGGVFVTSIPQQVSDPLWIASSIEDFVERACANDLADRPPYDLS